MTEKFSQKVTIYNDIVSDGVNPRRFDRFVIDRCSIQGGYVEKADGTIAKVVNSQTVITKDVKHYLPPYEYVELAEDEREDYYTVQVDDFIVYGEVDDVVTSSKEFQQLQQKYANRGWLVTSTTANIYGMRTDNVEITHA